MIRASAAAAAAGVTWENWQSPPQLQWSFQHIGDLFPVAVISRGGGPPADLPARLAQVADLPVRLRDGRSVTVGAIMAATDTDGWMAVHRGAVLAQEYPRGMAPGARHLLMSVSKSLIGTVTGALAAAGILATDRLVTDYVPALARSGYAGATVRDLLDMRSGIAFSEDYLDDGAEVRLLEEALGWAPPRHPGVPGTLQEFLLTLRAAAPHGGPFRYRSCESDVLGWACEAAAGTPMAELMSQLLWGRIGARHDAVIGVDSAGTGLFDGGICAALADLAAVGTMIVQGGTSATGTQVVPESWIADIRDGGPDSRSAFTRSPVDNELPGGMYRSQFWVPYPGRDIILCAGIHGQMIYVNFAADLVAVKLSSWPQPQDSAKFFATLAAFDAIAARA